MVEERISVGLGETLFPFRDADHQVNLVIVKGRPGLPIDFRIQTVLDGSIAGYFVCESPQYLHPLAVTTRYKKSESTIPRFIDPTASLDLSISLPDAHPLTAKIRPRYFQIRELRFWYYDPSLTLPRINSKDTLAKTTLPALVTPSVLGSDLYSAGEPFGGKLLVRNDSDNYLGEIGVVFTLPNTEAQESVLAAERQLWEVSWKAFDWGALYGSNSQKALSKLYALLSEGLIPFDQTELTLRLISRSRLPRTAEELIEQARVMQSAAQEWIENKITQLDRAWREQEKHFRM